MHVGQHSEVRERGIPGHILSGGRQHASGGRQHAGRDEGIDDILRLISDGLSKPRWARGIASNKRSTHFQAFE
jgi:hypothetical protein